MAEKGKRIIKSRLGEREIAEDAIIAFPHGLIGLEDKHEFVLLPLSESSPFLLLQCLTDPGLGLLVADPFPFVEDYEVHLDSAEKKILGLETVKQAGVVVTVSIPENKPELITLNLSGPIVMNSEKKIGLQSPQMEGKFPAHFQPIADKSG